LRKIYPSEVSIEELQAMGRFLLLLQNNDGSFVQKFDSAKGPVTNWHVLYYPGEAALAFAYLYEADHSPMWLIHSGAALGFLARSRAGHPNVPADHWALIATAKLLPYCKSDLCDISAELLIAHAGQICRSILREQLSGTDLDGTFDPTGRSAPTATRMEGILAALSFLSGGRTGDELQTAVNRGISFLLRAQITSGPYAGAVPAAFIRGAAPASDVRIDYLQHALCAWLRYECFINSRSDKK
jgi:hypothetical protein